MFIATYSRQKNIVKRVKNFALPLARSSPVALRAALGRREHANGEVLTEGRGKFGLKEGRGEGDTNRHSTSKFGAISTSKSRMPSKNLRGRVSVPPRPSIRGGVDP